MRITLVTPAAALVSVFGLATAMLAQTPASSPNANPTPADTPAASAPATPAADTVASPAADSPATAPANTSANSSTNSKIRIVRLSEVKGAVKLDRNIGRGFEDAIANLPVTEGSRLATGVGVAEVEFEDNSTLRLAPNSMVEFPRLELAPTGAKLSTVQVMKGTVYASMVGTKGNETTLLFGQQKLQLTPSSHVRLQMGQADAQLAVLDGNVPVEGPAGTTEAHKKQTLTFNLVDKSQTQVAKSVAPQDFDAWDKQSTDYHRASANFSSFGNAPYSYGLNDMSYYGAFTDLAGCGSMWRPYFVSAAWDPYSAGTWAWYPTGGYSWVSPYPWGWTPYHYGSWAYCAGAGWGWQPGGSWNGLGNMPTVLNRSNQPIHLPTVPRRPPVSGQATLLPASTHPLSRSEISGDKFVFRNDSAGLGVPRGSLGKLNGFSHEVQQHGSVAAPVSFPEAANHGATQNGAFHAPGLATSPTASQGPSHSNPSAGPSFGSAPTAGSRPGGSPSGPTGGGHPR